MEKKQVIISAIINKLQSQNPTPEWNLIVHKQQQILKLNVSIIWKFYSWVETPLFITSTRY